MAAAPVSSTPRPHKADLVPAKGVETHVSKEQSDVTQNSLRLALTESQSEWSFHTIQCVEHTLGE